MLQGKGNINERGGILVLALLFLFILTALGLAIILNSQIDQAISKNYSKTVKATFAAQTGIERLKPYLLYDLQRDPWGWQNNILWVPDGTPGATNGGTSPCTSVSTNSDCFELPAASLTPYVIPDDLADAHIDSIWTPDNAAGWGTYGYQLMLRNMNGAGGFDRNKICVLAGGYTDTTIGPLGTPSRGADLIEQCLIGEDISRWNNIIFIEGGDTSGMGNFKIHGNVHILGPPKPPAVDDINVDVKGNQGWYNDYTSGTPITTTLAAVLNPGEAARTSLEAKIRDRNGLIDAQNGSVEFGTTTTPFDAIFGCDDCPSGVYGFTNFAYNLTRSLEYGPYDVPASVYNQVKVPLLADQYKDERGVLYPDYASYLVGVQNAGGIANNNLPGVQGLRLESLNMPGNRELNFGTVTSNSIADYIADAPSGGERNEIFVANVNTAANANPVQQVIDPVTEPDPLFSPILAVTDKTFMLVATDTAKDVVIVYKEVQPFDRSVDKDLTGAGGFSTLHTTRQVNGFVFARHIDLTGLVLTVDLDGADLDMNSSNYLTTLSTTDSQRLLRKVTNALWLGSQGSCALDGDQPCYVQAPDASFVGSMSPTIGVSTGIFIATDASKLVGSGVIHLPDQFKMDNEGLRYAGRFSFLTRETSGSSTPNTNGVVNLKAGPRPVPNYTASGANYSFPCQNSMGIMAANKIDMGDPLGTHDEFAGAFYANIVLKVEKQIQILGAIVSKDFDLAGGGNPDWFQAMQMSRCLPPEMIGKEPIVYIRSQSYSDR